MFVSPRSRQPFIIVHNTIVRAASWFSHCHALSYQKSTVKLQCELNLWLFFAISFISGLLIERYEMGQLQITYNHICCGQKTFQCM